MANGVMMYLICTGTCLAIMVITGSVVYKWKRKMQAFELEKQELEIDKAKFLSEYSQLKKDQEDLKNAQILFRKEKESSADLSKKTEKEVVIDLFIKFIEMESTFDYMKNNLASIDVKLVGVKNYSKDLKSMENVLTTHLNELKAEMTSMQKNYSTTLSGIYGDLRKSLTSIEGRIEGIVSLITEREMQRMVQSMSSQFEEMEGVIKIETAQLSSVIDKRVANLAAEFGIEIEKSMPLLLSENDVENAVRNVLSYYTISDLDRGDVKQAVSDVLGDVFSYSYSFEDGLKEAIRDEVQSAMSYSSIDLSCIEDQLRRIEELANNVR